MMAAIKSHLSMAELEGRYETAADPISKSHFHGLWLLSKGLEIEEVAELLSFSTRWVYELVRRYNEGGPDCLGDQRVNNGAAARILTAEALAALKERIKTPPDDGGLWTGPKVARWLAKFHGLKSVHDQRGWDALVGIAYSIQKPRPRHPEAATEKDRAKLKKNFSGPLLRRNDRTRARRSKSGRWTRRVGAERRAPTRARSPSLRVALRSWLRRADHRPHDVECLKRCMQGNV